MAESAPERDEPLRLQEENFNLICEIRKLELKRSRRWNELVASNKWDNHENDAVVKELDYEIEQESLKQLKVWSILQESNEKIERLVQMVCSEVLPREGKAACAPSTQENAETKEESSDEKELDDEELDDYLFLLKVRKGEKKMFVQFLLNEDNAKWEGPFDLDLNEGDSPYPTQQLSSP